MSLNPTLICLILAVFTQQAFGVILPANGDDKTKVIKVTKPKRNPKVDNTTQEIAELRDRLNNLETLLGACNCKTETKPYFGLKVQMTNDTTPKEGEKIIFDKIIVHEGKSTYDVSTGVLAIPTTGMYSLFLKACSFGKNWDEVGIISDGVLLGKTMSWYTTCGTDGVFAFLEAGSEVWIERLDGRGSGIIRASHGVYFSAALVA